MSRSFFAALSLLFASACSAQVHPLREEVSSLKARAGEITKKIGELASKGNLQDSDEGIRLMKQFVDELAQIRERLSKIESQLAQQESSKADKKEVDRLGTDVANLKNTRFTGYIQFQYFDTDRVGSSKPDAFEVRRARLGIIQRIDNRASLRIAAEFAEGSARNETRLKDAVLEYDLTPNFGRPTRAMLGQMSLPLGYEISRSDVDREFPERATYNRSAFPGERSRGFMVRSEVAKNVFAGAGAFNALTIDDPEQNTVAPGPGSKLSALGFIRHEKKDLAVGLSAVAGERAATATAPETDRWFVYLDAMWRPIPKLRLRGEAMIGRDRLQPAAQNPSREAKPVSGFQLHAGYDFDAKHSLDLRWEQYDPDRDNASNAVNGYALSFQHYLSPFSKLMFAHEIFEDGTRISLGQRRYQQTTLRVQFRF